MTNEFPNSYVFYVFIMVVTIVTILVSPVQVVQVNPTIISFEPYFLFINGFAVATLILYAPYRFIIHMRRTNPGEEVRRDTFLVIFGISGFAIGELLFEILLPNFGVDLRAPGFIVEMALVGLIAFAVREKSFLQELIVPEAEAHLLTKPTYSLDRGYTYAVLERDASQAFEIFKDFVTHGTQGLCITRRAPKAVMTEYGLERTPILWLSRVATEKNAVRPSPPEKVALAVEHFIEVSEHPVVLLDGLEYLVSHNDFGSVLALVHDLNESVAMREAILLIPFDPTAFNERACWARWPRNSGRWRRSPARPRQTLLSCCRGARFRGRPRARRDPGPKAAGAHGRLCAESRHCRLFRADSAHGRDLRLGNPETRPPPGRLLGRMVRPVPPGRADPRAGRERARGDPPSRKAERR